MIFKCFGINRQNFRLAGGLPGSFVKTRSGLRAEEFLGQHLFGEPRKAKHIARFIGRSIVEQVARHAGEDVQPHQIERAESGGLGPADHGAGQLVHFVHAETLFLHGAQYLAYTERADAVRNEVRRILGAHHALSEAQIGELRYGGQHLGQRIRSRDDFKQMEIARRIKKMRPEPVAAKLLRKTRREASDRKPAGVGADYRARLAKRRDSGEQVALGLEILGDRFNDPVRFRDRGEVVVEISDGHASGQFVEKESRRFTLLGRFQARAGNPIAHGGQAQVQALLFLCRSQFGRNQVEKNRRDAAVRQVRRDPGTHRTGSQDCCALDGPLHDHSVAGIRSSFPVRREL